MDRIPHVVVLFLLFSLSSPPPARAAAMSPYDVLTSHGLPAGLLPKGVTQFKVDEQGRFEAHFDRPCTAKFDTQVQYDVNITGVLSYGQISALSGVSAQELFLWFPVHSVRVDIPSSGLIYFDVGVIFKRFSLSLFETPPDCKPVDEGEFKKKLRYKFNQRDGGDARRAVA